VAAVVGAAPVRALPRVRGLITEVPSTDNNTTGTTVADVLPGAPIGPLNHAGRHIGA